MSSSEGCPNDQVRLLEPVGLTIEARIESSGRRLNESLAAPLLVAATSVGLALPRPQIASIAVGDPKLAVVSFQFPGPDSDAAGPETGVDAAGGKPPSTAGRPQAQDDGPMIAGAVPGAPRARPAAATGPPAARRPPGPRREPATRIRPPGDVIKLEDRLYYLLQPPLETLLDAGNLELPLRPFPFQMEGVAFLYPRHHAILADEMGLGKTMQAITTIRLLVRERQLRRILLICPKALVSNWQREFSLWAPEIPLAVVAGSQARRRWLWNLADVVVTMANYELVLRDGEALARCSRPYDLVVLDESQRIKNLASATHQAVCGIPRRRSWSLTGTPIENRVEDLVGIFEFLSPGYLRREMSAPAIGRAVSDYVLRRTKEDVLDDLPPKLERTAQVELCAEQRAAYRSAEEDGVLHLAEMGAGLRIQHVLELILRLKQICNFDPATGASAKLERLLADLEECTASGRKAIIFSQWVGTLRRLAQAMPQLQPLQYHGRVPADRRDQVLEQFRRDPQRRVLLLSYGAGGVGLNLQFVPYVFLFDRWWNPAVEDQAIHRAYRIGTTGPVTVTKLLAAGTIEERIDQVLAEKRQLFHVVFASAQAPRSMGLSRAELLTLFQMPNVPGPNRRAA